jgi:hypothetical protein
MEYFVAHAAALAEVGRFDEAVKNARQARDKAAGAQPATQAIDRQLAEYEAKRPLRTPVGR